MHMLMTRRLIGELRRWTGGGKPLSTQSSTWLRSKVSGVVKVRMKKKNQKLDSYPKQLVQTTTTPVCGLQRTSGGQIRHIRHQLLRSRTSPPMVGNPGLQPQVEQRRVWCILLKVRGLFIPSIAGKCSMHPPWWCSAGCQHPPWCFLSNVRGALCCWPHVWGQWSACLLVFWRWKVY